MVLDIAILVAAALCQGATGYWAFHMSAQDKHARWGFAAITGLGIVLVICSGIRTYQSSSHIERSIGHIEKTLGTLSLAHESGAFYVGNTLVARFSKFIQDDTDTSIIRFPAISSHQSMDFSQIFSVQGFALKCTPANQTGRVTMGGESVHEYFNVICRIVGNVP